MPHFLIQKEEIKGNFIELIDKDNLFHIVKVRRIKINECIKNKNVIREISVN